MRLHIGQGSEVGSLTVFPVWSDQTTRGRRHYETDTARLDLGEVGGGPTVSRLAAVNHGRRPVLVLDGQLFEGGWQHRMSTRSVVVEPGRREQIDVACVEQARWGGGAVQHSRGRRAPTVVREGYGTGDQHEVWTRVERFAGDIPTRSLVARMDADERDRPPVEEVEPSAPLPGQVGVLIGIGGQPLTLEVFDHPDTLREQFDAIVRAARLDAIDVAPNPTPGRRARRLVERIERRSDSVDVRRLDHRGRTLHLRATYRRHPLLAGV